MRRVRTVEGILAPRRSAGIVPFIFCCILLLLASRIVRAQADGTPPPADGTPSDITPSDGTPEDGTPSDGTPYDGTPDDAPDLDALARVKSSVAPAALTGSFVTRAGNHFVQDGHNFLVRGVNFKLRDHGWDIWYHYNDPGVKAEVDAELQKARDLRANVIRIFVTTDNFGGVFPIWGQLKKPFFDTALTDLDDFLARADSKGLKVLITLYDGVNAVTQIPPQTPYPKLCRGNIGNPYSGAYAWENTNQDGNPNSWPGGPDIRPFRDHADGLLTHNIPGKNYTLATDPRVFGWDVMNEPDHMYHPQPQCTNVFYNQAFVNRWIAWMARHMRNYDQTHPIGSGSYGWFLNPGYAHRPSIVCTPSSIQEVWNATDFVSIHWYEPNTYLDPALACAQGSGLPVVLEEIGQADGGYQDNCAAQPWNEASVNSWTSGWAGIANNRALNGALVWTNFNFNPGSGNPHSYNQCGQISNSNFFGMYRTDGSLKPAGATFRQNALTPSCSRASFRAYDGTHYLTTAAGSLLLTAAATYSSRTAFTVIPGQGGGYYFGLLSPANRYVSADNGGGGAIHVDKTSLLWWESIGVVPLERLSSTQWKVALHASNNQFFSADNGGGGAVYANRNAVLAPETFVMSCE